MPTAAFYSWGDDDTDVHVDRRSPLRPLGQSGHLAVDGTDQATVVQTLTADDMQAALAAADGSAPSVLDTGPFAAAATMLDDAGVTVLQAIGVPGTTLFMPPLDASPTRSSNCSPRFPSWCPTPASSWSRWSTPTATPAPRSRSPTSTTRRRPPTPRRWRRGWPTAPIR